MAIREGRWDCGTCGSAALLGRDVVCPSCGTPRPQGTRFYLPEDADEIADSERLVQAGGGADWVCEHCASSARASDECCPGCGAPRGTSPTQSVADYSLMDVPRGGAGGGTERRAFAAPPPPPAPAARPSGLRGWAKRGVVAVLALLGWGYFRPREITATLAEKSWERSLEIEAYRTVRESGWDVPTGGRPINQYRAIRSYRQELDHYEQRTRTVTEQVQVGTRTYTCGQRDLGNGYFEDRTCTEPEYESRSHEESYQEPIYRQVPIYGTKYDYDVERWVTDTVLVAQGTADDPADADAPAWPRTRQAERLREGDRKEKYVLVFRDDRNRSYQREVPLEQYQALRVGTPTRIRVNNAGMILEVKGPGSAPE
jgi:hypothetical protein